MPTHVLELGRPTLATLESTAFLALGFGAVNGQDFRTRRDPLGRFTLFLISQLVSGSRVSLTQGRAGPAWKLQGESTGPAITLWENRIFLQNKTSLQDHNSDLLLGASGLQSDLLVVEARARGQFFWASATKKVDNHRLES